MLHVRKEDDFPNGRSIGEQHDQTVDADALTGGRRHPVLQGFNIVVIHTMRFFIACLPPFNLLTKAFKLVGRIIELREPVGYLAPGNKQFKSLGKIRLPITASGQGGDFGRIFSNKSRLNQLGLHQGVKQFGDHLAQLSGFGNFNPLLGGKLEEPFLVI